MQQQPARTEAGSPPGFRMVPPRDAVEGIPRELRFFPVQNDHPQVLAHEQIAHFNRHGYLTGLRIFDEEEIAQHRRYFDELLARVMAAGGDSYSISTAHMRYGKVYDLLTNDRIVACVRDLLGEPLIGWGSHYFCKMPHDGKKVDWHQDASYWPLTPSKTVTVWLAIDDADRDNACVQFLPGSHRYGHLAFDESGRDEGNVLDQSIRDIARFGDPVDVVLRAGEISMHSDLLVHGSQANGSNRRRCGLTLRYCPADVRAFLDWNLKGVVVAGADTSGHWANPPRPAAN